MPLTLYGLKNCDTCRKALKALDDTDHTVTFTDVRTDGISKKMIKAWVDHVGWEKILNTRSTTWRGIDADKKENLTKAKAIDLMAEHPTLIKRPVIETGTDIHVGWTKDTQAAILR